MKAWLRGQWVHSVAKCHYDQYTTLGRWTLWLPVWFGACIIGPLMLGVFYLMSPLLLAAGYLATKLEDGPVSLRFFK
jgi:hypothetical protein